MHRENGRLRTGLPRLSAHPVGAEEKGGTGDIRPVETHLPRRYRPVAMAGLARQDLDFTNSRTVVLTPEIVWTFREGDYVVVDAAGWR